MARLPRLAIPGELHQVLQRGHNRQAVFVDDIDRRLYIEALREAATAHGVAIHGYALTDSQVRLLVTPSAAESLSRTMQAIGRRYVPAFNARHRRSGTLWEGRFRAAPIEASAYFLSALVQLESLPVREAGAVHARDWPWSSARHHLGLSGDPVVTDHPLYWQLGNTPFDREAAYRRLLEQGVTAAVAQVLERSVEKGWPLGDRAFLDSIAKLSDRPLVPKPRGRPKRADLPSADTTT